MLDKDAVKAFRQFQSELNPLTFADVVRAIIKLAFWGLVVAALIKYLW